MTRARTLAVAVVAILASAAPAAQGAVGDWSSTYDWPAGSGSAGWSATDVEMPFPIFPGPYYTSRLGSGGAHGPGLETKPIGGLLHDNPDDSLPGGGPRLIFSLRAPGTTWVSSATFDGIDFLNDGEGQILRLALYPESGTAGATVRDFAPPTPSPGELLSNASATLGAADGASPKYAQVWMHSVCGEQTAGSGVYDDCHTLPAAPASFAHVGRIALHLKDVEDPTVVIAGLPPGWTNSRATLAVATTAADPGSGVLNLRLSVATAGRPVRELTGTAGQPAACDVAHTSSGGDSRVCPEALAATPSDALSRLPEGPSVYRATATDLSGRSTTAQATVMIDRTAPTGVTAAGLPKASHWSPPRDSLSAVVTAVDRRSGVAAFRLYLDGRLAGSTAAGAAGRPAAGKASGGVRLSRAGLATGRHRVSASAVDRAANASPPRHVGDLSIDATAPTIARPRVSGRTVSVPARDGQSGVETVQVARAVAGSQGPWRRLARPWKLRVGSAATTLWFRAFDAVGNVSVVVRTAVAAVRKPGGAKPPKKPGLQSRRDPDYGLSDQEPSSLARPDFRALGVRFIRMIVPFDVAECMPDKPPPGTRPAPKEEPPPPPRPGCQGNDARAKDLNDWVDAALSFQPSPFEPALEKLVSFERHDGPVSIAPGEGDCSLAVTPDPAHPGRLICAGLYTPSVATYTAAVTRFMANWGPGTRANIHDFTAWNEPNLRGYQPTGDPKFAYRAGQYYGALKAACRGCVVAAGDFSDAYMPDAGDARSMGGQYYRAYLEGATHTADGRKVPPPALWAWHSYQDGKDAGQDAVCPSRSALSACKGRPARPFTPWKRFRAFLEETRTGDVWLTEQGAVRVQSFRPKPAHDAKVAQAVMEAFVNGPNALTRVSPRIRRFYVYPMQGDALFDAGLVNPDGTPRPIYCTYFRATTGRGGCRAAPVKSFPLLDSSLTCNDMSAATGIAVTGTLLVTQPAGRETTDPSVKDVRVTIAYRDASNVRRVVHATTAAYGKDVKHVEFRASARWPIRAGERPVATWAGDEVIKPARAECTRPATTARVVAPPTAAFGLAGVRP